ncbi:MAG: hypothetical protein K8R59_05085 [Thermoanaerobaculales bacterium]|nr:hypothetical protein [Thermoanaerobaculales bacterium]
MGEVQITTQPATTSAEFLRIGVIFAVLVAIVSVPALLWVYHERNRPVLAEVRVVAATDSDPVFRQGPRIVEAGETVQAAVALRLDFPGRGSKWYAPVERLVLDGESVPHVNTGEWPEEDRKARVFWFTLEGPFLGGSLASGDLGQKLAYRSFLAPELGHAWLADGEPETHADDGVNLGLNLVSPAAGTYRIYTRVHVTEEKGGTQALFAATSLGAQHLMDEQMVRISRRLDPELGLHPAAGELFRLPGFEPSQDDPPDMDLLCRQRLATSSRTFAATATSGVPHFDETTLRSLRSFLWTEQGLEAPSGSLRWNSDIQKSDLLRRGDHWLVLLSDDGDGVLGPGDTLAHCRRRPAAILSLGMALSHSAERVEVLRPQ